MTCCPVCERHGEVHRQTAVPGGFTVDAALLPLLSSLWAVGVETLSSCVDLGEALRVLWPEAVPDVLTAPQPMHYRSVVERRLAYVRCLDTPAVGGLCRAAEDAGGEVLRVAGVVQVAFDPALLGVAA